MEEEINPYASPQTDPSVAPDIGDGPFGDLDFEQVVRLRNHSHSIRALGLVGFIALGAVIFLDVKGEGSIIGNLIGAGGVVGVVASWWRPVWGQVGGILFCCVLLIGFPVGTALGAFGILAFAQSGRAFGPGRYRHKEIEMEWRARKRALHQVRNSY